VPSDGGATSASTIARKRAPCSPPSATLAAVRDRTPEPVAFFGCMYYAALRPEEVLNLRDDEYERPRVKSGWGVLHLTGSTVAAGHGWSDEDGTPEAPDQNVA
jgi:hypothetical protein